MSTPTCSGSSTSGSCWARWKGSTAETMTPSPMPRAVVRLQRWRCRARRNLPMWRRVGAAPDVAGRGCVEVLPGHLADAAAGGRRTRRRSGSKWWSSAGRWPRRRWAVCKDDRMTKGWSGGSCARTGFTGQHGTKTSHRAMPGTKARPEAHSSTAREARRPVTARPPAGCAGPTSGRPIGHLVTKNKYGTPTDWRLEDGQEHCLPAIPSCTRNSTPPTGHMQVHDKVVESR